MRYDGGMGVVQKIRLMAGLLMLLVVVSGIIITIAHLVQDQMVRRTLIVSELAQTFHMRNTLMRSIFLTGDLDRLSEIEVFDATIRDLRAKAKETYPVQHEGQQLLADMSREHEAMQTLREESKRLELGGIVDGGEIDLVMRLSAMSQAVVSTMGDLSRMNGVELLRVLRIAHSLLLLGLSTMIVVILVGAMAVYKAFAQPIAHLYDLVSSQELGKHAHAVAFPGQKRVLGEIDSVEAALRILHKKVEDLSAEKNSRLG